MTRFFVKIECEEIVKRLIKYCEKEKYAYRVNESGVVRYNIKINSKEHDDISCVPAFTGVLKICISPLIVNIAI